AGGLQGYRGGSQRRSQCRSREPCRTIETDRCHQRMSGANMTLQEKVQNDIAQAMRSKDSLRLNVLRMMKTAVKNKEIEKMKPLDEPEVLAVFNTLVKQRKDSIDQFRKGGREELAQKEESEITVIEEYLPAAASDDDVRAAIEQSIAETGAA